MCVLVLLCITCLHWRALLLPCCFLGAVYGFVELMMSLNAVAMWNPNAAVVETLVLSINHDFMYALVWLMLLLVIMWLISWLCYYIVFGLLLNLTYHCCYHKNDEYPAVCHAGRVLFWWLMFEWWWWMLLLFKPITLSIIIPCCCLFGLVDK